MSYPKTLLTGFCLAAALAAEPSMAETSSRTHSAHSTRAGHGACCRAPAGTQVQVELAQPVSSRTAKAGDKFALRLAEPLVVDGELLLRKGTPGVGEVISASKPGMGGKSGKLVLAAEYLNVRGRHLALQGLELARAGHSNATEASAIGLTGIVFAPLGFIGLAVHGGNVDLTEGMSAMAKLTHDVVLPSLGRATAPPPSATETADQEAAEHSAIQIPAPPHGEGQVVFFRKYSVLNTLQWFKVRENGKAICKLTNGAYCIVVTAPGEHTYTAKFEPEMKDHLTLQIGPGDVYYVEGTTSKALLLGAADLSPSSVESFSEASKHLKPAPPMTPEEADQAPPEAKR